MSSVHSAGDPRIRLKQLAAVVAEGWRATLITGDLKAESGDGVDVLKVRPGRKRRLLRMLLTAPRAVLLARRLKADLYQIHDPELLPWSYLLLATGRPVVYDIHEDLWLSIRQKPYLPLWVRKPLATIAGRVEALLAAPLHQIAAETYYQQRYPKALSVLNYPSLTFSTPSFEANSDELLYTGNVTLDRGAMTLAVIAKNNPNLRVTSIGYCPEALAASMQHEAHLGNLKIIGAGEFVPFSEIVAAYRRKWLAALVVFTDTPHYQKKQATKFFEYMAAGLPIIASNFPAWSALIEGNGVGICIPAGDAKAAADAAFWLKAHPNEGRAMGLRGQKLIATKFNWSREANRLIAFYKEILAGKP